MLLNRVCLLALSILVVGHTSSANHYVTDHYIYWSNASIQSPELFAIDPSNERIVLAAKNNVCHLTLDLMNALNVRNTSPTNNEIYNCVNDPTIFKPIEKCHNFHHIILFPNANTITINSQTIAGNETILVCGSNAYHPKCIYRNRTDLSELKEYSGVEFSPYDEETVSASLLSSNGKLLSGTSLNVNADKYGFTMSNSPFDGTTAVRTLPGLLMFNKPKFVDIYERGDYFYFFMREIAEESNSDSQIYSRAARVCKNETGTQYQNKGYSVFTTFLKARITCESRLKQEDGFPYIYNDLQDTVHIADGTIDSSVNGEYLYGIFTSPVNGPAGSVLCVYTFGKGTNDLIDVFKKKYLIQSGENEWTSEDNPHPVTCGNRSTSLADDFFLMEPVVAQARSPLIQEDGLLYQRLVVDQVIGVDDEKYDVLIIAAIDEESNVYLLKKTYVSSRSGDHVHTSETISLNHTSNQIVGKMELYKNNDKVSVYLSTNEGIYAVNISDCSKYKDCSACVSARDPYCAYNSANSSCVSTLSNKGLTLLQDIVNGNTESCPIISTTSVTLIPTTNTIIDNVITSTLTMTSSICTNTIIFTTIARETITATTTVVITPTPRIAIVSTTPPTVKPTVHIPIRTAAEPSIVPISEGTDSGEDYIWTIVAACGGLIVGIVLGFFCFALVRNKDRFCWGKFFSRRNGYNYDEEKVDDFEMTQVHKIQDTRNNSYSKVPQRPSTPPITKFNPTLANGGPCHKVTDSPVLSKYSNTERTHNRSMSSGGQFIPSLFPVPTNGTALSPIGPNLRQTFHVEEPMSNSQRQKFGKNMVGRQLSKEYPMTNSFHAHTNGYHVKTGSLDLDYDKITHK